MRSYGSARDDDDDARPFIGDGLHGARQLAGAVVCFVEEIGENGERVDADQRGLAGFDAALLQDDMFGIFGGIGIGLTKNLGLSAAWSGEYVNLGAALRFDGLDNFSIGATLSDTFNQKNSRRIDVSFTYFLTDLF